MMGDESSEVSSDEMRRAIQQAILLNEYLLRRAWGILFIVMGFSMFLSIFGSPILSSLEPITFAGSIAIDMIASGSGVIVVLWAFKRVRNAAEITHPDGDRTWAKLLGYRFLVPLWIVTELLFALTFVLARPRVPLVFELVHLGLSIYLYYALTLSFSKKIPGEALIAIASLSLSSIASLALLSITIEPGPYVLLWGATITAWILSGIYARTRPVPEFEAERTGLE